MINGSEVDFITSWRGYWWIYRSDTFWHATQPARPGTKSPTSFSNLTIPEGSELWRTELLPNGTVQNPPWELWPFASTTWSVYTWLQTNITSSSLLWSLIRILLRTNLRSSFSIQRPWVHCISYLFHLGFSLLEVIIESRLCHSISGAHG